MSKEIIYSRSYRIRKAYWTAAVVIFSYMRLSFLRRFFGQKWYNRRILALHIYNAERVKTVILELNGLFIKLGQLLSIFTSFLPDAFQKPLESLQDQIPARPFDLVNKRISKELGQPVSELFAAFDENDVDTCYRAYHCAAVGGCFGGNFDVECLHVQAHRRTKPLKILG